MYLLINRRHTSDHDMNCFSTCFLLLLLPAACLLLTSLPACCLPCCLLAAYLAAAFAAAAAGNAAGGLLSSVGDAAKSLLGGLLGPFEREAAPEESAAVVAGEEGAGSCWLRLWST
jgi:hypothetical protein